MSTDETFSDTELVMLRSASMLRYFTVEEVAKHAHADMVEAKEFFAAHDDLFASNQNSKQANFKWTLSVKLEEFDTITKILQENRLRLNIRVAELDLLHGDKEDRLFLYCLDRVAASLLEVRKFTAGNNIDAGLLSRLAEAEREFVSVRDSTPLRDEFAQPVNRSNTGMFARLFEVSSG